MLPGNAKANRTDDAMGHSVARGYRDGGFRRCPDFANVFFGELGAWASLALAKINNTRATLGVSVIVVVGLRTKEQMRRIYARRIVTLVKDMKIVGDRSVVNDPRGAMGSVNLSAEIPVAEIVERGNPRPAFIGVAHVNFRPEPLLKSFPGVMIHDVAKRDALRAIIGNARMVGDRSSFSASALTKANRYRRLDVLHKHLPCAVNRNRARMQLLHGSDYPTNKRRDSLAIS